MRKRLENKQGTYTNIADQLHVTDTDIRSHFDSHTNYVLGGDKPYVYVRRSI